MTTIIFDFNRTLYEPDTGVLVDGAHEVLQQLQTAGIQLCLVSRNEPGRQKTLDALGITDYFAKIVFLEEKTPEVFLTIMKAVQADITDTYVIGDHLHDEIRAANAARIRTIWLRRGAFAHLRPETQLDRPWKTVERLPDVLHLFGLQS